MTFLLGCLTAWLWVGCLLKSFQALRYYLYMRHEIRRRFYDAVFLDGEILDVAGGEMVTVHYLFFTPDQQRLEGWTSAYRPDLKNKLPLVGTPIIVCYRDDLNHMAL